MTTKKSLQMTLNLDRLNIERATNFFDLYALETAIGDSEKKYFLGNKNQRVCRFCKKTVPEVTFRKDAHVIPQFMGNRNLLSYFECDTCNELFSTYEDSFSKFFGVTRTFAQIKGQNRKVPKFKDPKTGLEVFLGDSGLQMTMIEGHDPISIDSEKKSLEITTERPAYIPIHIPKTIIKIGLCMLSEDDLSDYDYARRFIHQTEQDVHFKDNGMLKIYGYFIPGPPKFQSPFAQIYKKKEDKAGQPCTTRQVMLYYANYYFQMMMPFADSDKWLQGRKADIPLFPLLVDNSYFEKFGLYQQFNLNLTSHERQKGEEHKISFHFDSFNQIL